MYTNKGGLNYITDFIIHKDNNWHLSDHKPISIDLLVPNIISSSFLYKRSKQLNYEFDPNHTEVFRHMGSYDDTKITNYLGSNKVIIENEILTELDKCNIDKAVIKLNSHLNQAHKVAKKKRR